MWTVKVKTKWEQEKWSCEGSCCGFGVWVWVMLTVYDERTSKSGRIVPRALHSWEEEMKNLSNAWSKSKWLVIKTCSTNSTIWSSVVSLVRNSSMSVTRSMQIAQVSALLPCKILIFYAFWVLLKTLGREDTDAKRLARRMRGIFMVKAKLRVNMAVTRF